MKIGTKIGTLTLTASLIFAGASVGQELPPEVLLLSRVKRHNQEESRRLRDVSCLETVKREYQPAKGKMRPLDTVRLEVLSDGDKELFASPGNRKFSEGHPMSYAGSGTLGDGIFSIDLQEVLGSWYASSEYKGEEEIDGQRLARYDYRLPLMWSRQTIQTPEGSGRVSLHGSFWADLVTYDVRRLEMDSGDFPPALPVTEATTAINYAQTRVRDDFTVLLPTSAEFRMVKFSGEISHSQVQFTNCHVFGAASSIGFGANLAEELPRFGVASVDVTLRALPGGLQIAVKLRSRVSANMAVGALIAGVVASNVPAKSVVIIAGSPVRGRIRRLERYSDPFPHFVVALEFTEVEVEGIRYRFCADLLEIESSPGVEQTLSTLEPSEGNAR